MRFLAILLVSGAFMRHGAANVLAGSLGIAAPGWFYILGGAWEVVLCGSVAWMAYGYRESMWRWLVLAAASIGALEGAQISACRLAVADMASVPSGANLCDFATGLPVGPVMFTLYLLIVSYGIGLACRKG